MITRELIIAEARTWLGTPFQHQGRVKGVGVDCGGLLIGVGRALGMDVDEPPAYDMSPQPDIILYMLKKYCCRIELGSMEAGDVIWFSFAGEPRHVGIATDIGVIHAWAKPGKVVEHRMDEVWIKRIRSVWTLKELVNGCNSPI